MPLTTQGKLINQFTLCLLKNIEELKYQVYY
jgi:hypothetical protein